MKDIITEGGMSDIAALLDDVINRVKVVGSANAMPQDYINQIGLRFQLYDNDPTPCVAYWEIIGDPGSTREGETRKFEKRIISAAISANPSLRNSPRLTYQQAKSVLGQRSVGRKAIATLTNPQHWKLVSVEQGGLKWPPPRSSFSPR